MRQRHGVLGHAVLVGARGGVGHTAALVRHPHGVLAPLTHKFGNPARSIAPLCTCHGFEHDRFVEMLVWVQHCIAAHPVAQDRNSVQGPMDMYCSHEDSVLHAIMAG